MTIEEAIIFANYAQDMAKLQDVKEFYALAVAALREQEERRWIPVKERLPEHGDVVLCFMKFGEHRILQWDNVSSLWLGYGHGDDWQKADVTNWMPLPEPPKEDNCEILQRLCWL